MSAAKIGVRGRVVERAALAVALLLLACEPVKERGQAPAPPDPLWRSAPIRVVSLSPVASRFALALDAGSLLVGVDPESSQLPELAHLPVVDAASAVDLAPDLILVPEAPASDDPNHRALEGSDARVIEFAPHDLEDVTALCRTLGRELAGRARAERFEFELSRPLARIGGSSWGRRRPRVVAWVGLDPPLLAGGHSFETDLIEIAGGRSVTHGGEEPRLDLDADALAAYAPDLVLVVTPSALSAADRRSARAKLPDAARVEFFTVDTEVFWLEAPAEDAARLRALIEPISRELETTRSESPTWGGTTRRPGAGPPPPPG